MSFQEFEPGELSRRIEENAAILIDVREPHEFAAERLEGALLHPLSTFEPGALPDDRSRQVVLQCGSGKRSMMALERCRAAGVPVTAHLLGGLMAWKSAGLPTVSVDPATGNVITKP